LRWPNVWWCERSPARRQQAPRHRPTGFGVGRAVAKSPDRALVRAGHGGASDRQDRLHLEDQVREVIHNFNADGFHALAPKYSGGRPVKFTLPERQEIKKVALSRPQDHGLPFSTWSLSKLAEYLVAEGVIDDISTRVSHPAPGGRRHLSGDKDLEAVERSRLRGEEEPHPRALRDRRRQSPAGQG
jgi:hypothetical protein